MWTEAGHVGRGHGIQSSEVGPYLDGQLIFSKGAKVIQWGNV